GRRRGRLPLVFVPTPSSLACVPDPDPFVMSNTLARTLCAVTGRLALCAVGLASQLPTTAATAAEPAPPSWQAERGPQRAKLLADLGADHWHATGFRGP